MSVILLATPEPGPLLGCMQKKTISKKRPLKLNLQRVRMLTSQDLEGSIGGQKCDYSGFGSLNGKSCNTCNLGL